MREIALTRPVRIHDEQVVVPRVIAAPVTPEGDQLAAWRPGRRIMCQLTCKSPLARAIRVDDKDFGAPPSRGFVDDSLEHDLAPGPQGGLRRRRYRQAMRPKRVARVPISGSSRTGFAPDAPLRAGQSSTRWCAWSSRGRKRTDSNERAWLARQGIHAVARASSWHQVGRRGGVLGFGDRLSERDRRGRRPWDRRRSQSARGRGRARRGRRST